MTAYRIAGGFPSDADAVIRLDDNQVVFPDSEDWPAYQAWLADGNAPLPAPVMPPPTEVSAAVFFARFSDAEKAAIWSTAVANPQFGVGLVHGLANGAIGLTGDIVKAWMGGLVVAGAITAERETEILTP